jgi:hypothetical protein
MILFREEHVEPILSGRKTQTRRLGNKRWNVGAKHACYTRPPFTRGGSEPFARVRILNVRRQALGEMSRAEVLAEGYRTWPEYMAALARIHGRELEPEDEVWAVTFAVVRL